MDQGDATPRDDLPLPVSRFSLRLDPLSPIAFSPNRGSTLRGGFGRALKVVACTVPDAPCPACSLYRRCPYPYLFETPLPEDALRMPNKVNKGVRHALLTFLDFLRIIPAWHENRESIFQALSTTLSAEVIKVSGSFRMTPTGSGIWICFKKPDSGLTFACTPMC